MARFRRIISTIDSHTAGESTRLVVSGLPPVAGHTIAEKLAFAEQHLSWVPGLTMLEPRGHKDMYGAVLLPACTPGADVGVIFMDNKGFEPMCGHAVIGVVTSLIEVGMVEPGHPEVEVTLDTAAGLVRAAAHIRHGAVESVSFTSVPAFVFRQNVNLHAPPIGDVTVDIAFGGNFFVLVNASQVGVELIAANTALLADLGMAILEAANDAVSVVHPDLPQIRRIIDLRFWDTPGGDEVTTRNVVVLGDHMVDRSPCGTGTCAEMALRHARGQLTIGERFVAESVIGTRFVGEVVAETEVGKGESAIPAIVPKVTGSAYLTGLNQLVIEPNDPFPQGFWLKS